MATCSVLCLGSSKMTLLVVGALQKVTGIFFVQYFSCDHNMRIIGGPVFNRKSHSNHVAVQ